MRHAIGLILAGLGAFLVAAAALMRFYLAGEVIKFPLNEYVVATLVGHNVSYFSQQQLTEVTGDTVQVTQTVKGDVAAGSASTAVWQEFTSVRDVTSSQSVLTTAQRSAFNRHTGALVDCCGEYVGGNTSVRQSGQGYVWPIGTQKRSYQVFDPDLLRPEPFRYAGTGTIDGMTAYRFVEQVGNQMTGSQTLPGWLFGFRHRRTVTLSEYITKTSTVWVDPLTGIPVDETQSLDRSLQASGVTKLVLFRGTVTETSQSVADAIGNAGSYHVRMDLLQGAGPLGAILLGVLLAGLGAVLTRALPAAAGRRVSPELGYQNGGAPSVRPSLPAGPGAWPPARPEPAIRNGTGHWTSTRSWDNIGTRQAPEHGAGNGYWRGRRPQQVTQARQEPGPWGSGWQEPGPREGARQEPGPWPNIRQEPGPWERTGAPERWGDGGRRVLEPGEAEPRLDRGSRGGRHRAPRQ